MGHSELSDAVADEVTHAQYESSDIGLELAGIEINERGYVKVNERLQTTAPGVWAIGDCAGSPHFTHISFDDFRVVRDNILSAKNDTIQQPAPGELANSRA